MGEPASQHVYVSTACIHGECGSCRNNCKFCGAPCRHDCHPAGVTASASPVDQAREIARDLMDAFTAGKISHDLLARIKNDPGLFWLRGEEQPPGTWEAP